MFKTVPVYYLLQKYIEYLKQYISSKASSHWSTDAWSFLQPCLPIIDLVFTNYSKLAKADLSGWYFDSKTSVCSSSLEKYKAMASEFLALFVFEKYFPLIFHKCSKIFFEGITPRKGTLVHHLGARTCNEVYPEILAHHM